MAPRKKPARRPRARQSGTRHTATARLNRTWDDTREALGTAEATVEKRVRALVKKSGLDTRKAAATLSAWRNRLERERRRAVKRFDTELGLLQSRAKKERRAMGRMVDDAVQGALAALNIPSRKEVHELTRRVEDLSRKIDGFRHSPGRSPRTRAAARANA
jgi:polyhydroxyalkanoate synthesis regulator phasin